uniref:Ankyrin n=1 Tax=Medicago truncatula TaxID=3880 RepID=A2Q5K5_MEDTR|nr:Ankyrin [Medicago truncatula]
MRTAANTLNNKGLTPLDILNKHSQADFIDIAIQYILIEAGVQKTCTNAHASSTNEPHQSNTLKNWENFLSKYIQHQGNWIEETRGTSMIAATMTFQSALNPPGGVWQENTLALLIIMWMLTVAMTIAVTFMMLTYLWAIGLVTPDHIIYYDAYRLGFLLGGAWGVIFLVLALIQIVRCGFNIKTHNCNHNFENWFGKKLPSDFINIVISCSKGVIRRLNIPPQVLTSFRQVNDKD